MKKLESLLSLSSAVAALWLLSVPVVFGESLPSDWEARVRLGVGAYEAGENKVAFNIFSKLLQQGSAQAGASNPQLARIYTNMGEVYDQEQEYKYAEQCIKKGLSMTRARYGANSPETLPALIDLAQTYVGEGKFSQAESLFKQALAISSKPGDERLLPFVVVSEADFGLMYFLERKPVLADPHFKHAWSLAARVLGANHKWTITIGGMYAVCLKAEGKTKEAKAIEKEAIAKANEAQVPIAIWNKQIQLADIAINSKHFADAEAALKLAMQAAQQLTAEPALQLIVLTKYGKLMLAQDKPALAIQKLKAAQSLADNIFGSEDKDVLVHARQLAELERAHDQFADAEPLYLRLADHVKKEHGSDSEQYEQALKDLADLYKSWAQYPKAVQRYTELLAIQEQRFGARSEKLIPCLMALATAVQNNTQYLAVTNEKAEGYLQRAHDLASSHFGKDSKEDTAVLEALSQYYQRHFNWDEAIKSCSQVVTADEKNFGPNSDETIKALDRYAVVLRAAGLRDQAEPIEQRLAKLREAKTTHN